MPVRALQPSSYFLLASISWYKKPNARKGITTIVLRTILIYFFCIKNQMPVRALQLSWKLWSHRSLRIKNQMPVRALQPNNQLPGCISVLRIKNQMPVRALQSIVARDICPRRIRVKNKCPYRPYKSWNPWSTVFVRSYSEVSLTFSFSALALIASQVFKTIIWQTQPPNIRVFSLKPLLCWFRTDNLG